MLEFLKDLFLGFGEGILQSLIFREFFGLVLIISGILLLIGLFLMRNFLKALLIGFCGYILLIITWYVEFHISALLGIVMMIIIIIIIIMIIAFVTKDL